MLQIHIGPEQSHLGDLWALSSFILETGLPAQVACHHQDIAATMLKILGSFDTDARLVTVAVGERMPGSFSPDADDYSVLYARRYLRTRRRWCKERNTRASTLCYNVDAAWRAADKIPPYVDDLTEVLRRQFNAAPIGLPMAIDAAVEHLAQCDLFLSVDSGLAHVARSVGCPLVLIEYRHSLARGFPPACCEFSVVRSAAECLDLVRSLLALPAPPR
jgi:Glycosyltransferase family 9 (heptosyltransferase)